MGIRNHMKMYGCEIDTTECGIDTMECGIDMMECGVEVKRAKTELEGRQVYVAEARRR